MGLCTGRKPAYKRRRYCATKSTLGRNPNRIKLANIMATRTKHPSVRLLMHDPYVCIICIPAAHKIDEGNKEIAIGQDSPPGQTSSLKNQ